MCVPSLYLEAHVAHALLVGGDLLRTLRLA